MISVKSLVYWSSGQRLIPAAKAIPSCSLSPHVTVTLYLFYPKATIAAAGTSLKII